MTGTNTRRVRRALGSLFAGAVGKDATNRVWRKVTSDRNACGTLKIVSADGAVGFLEPKRVDIS